MLKTISKITGKHDAAAQEKLLRVLAKADSIVTSNIGQQMQQAAAHYITSEGHGSLNRAQLTAMLEQEICSYLQGYSAVRQQIDLDGNATRRILVIAIYRDLSVFAIADCTLVSNQVVAVIQKYTQSEKAGSFAENIVATRLMESVAAKHLHLAAGLTPDMFLPAAKRVFNIASHGYLPEGVIEELLVFDGMPVEFTVHLKSHHTSELLLPLLGADGKLSGKLKKFFSESLVFPSSLNGIICTGSYAANVWLQQKLKSDFRLPLFISQRVPCLLNQKKKQPEESSLQFTSFSIKSDPDLTPSKEMQLKKQGAIEHVWLVVQRETQELKEKQIQELKEKQINDNELLYTDQVTGLQWTRNANLADKIMTWDEAQKWAAALDYAGYKDWRMPTKDEFELFVKKGGSNPSEWFNSNGFNYVQAYFYWSSSTYADYTDYAWIVDVGYGYVGNVNKYNYHKYSSLYVWPVRAGQ